MRSREPSSLDEERAALAAALPSYEVGGVLGRGAFAVVYAARHVRLGRDVAVKRLSPTLLRDRDARERFAAEARLLASLDHPHVVRLYDYVESETVCALVMERLGGETLAERMRVSAFPPARACAVAVAVLHGLAHAHQFGVLHRDIKPENILFGSGDVVKVADFGIAKVIGAQGGRLTTTGRTLGTPAFMAPEQVSRSIGPISAATDVWAVGAMLYELLAGEPPFPPGAEFSEMLHHRVTQEVRPLVEAAPGVPAELAPVVMRALERDPAKRYQTAGAFASALESATEHALGRGALAESGIPLFPSGPERGDHAPATIVRGHENPPPSRGALQGLRRLPTRLRALAATGAVAAAVGVVLALTGGGGPATAVASPPPGWPHVMSLGWVDQVDGPAGVARRGGQGSSTSAVFSGDAAIGKDWSHDPTASPAAFALKAFGQGLLPYAVYYELRAIGRTGHDDALAPQIRQTLVDRRLMGIYWRNVRGFLKALGSTGHPAAVSVESGFWALLEQQLSFSGEGFDSVHAFVGGSGVPELRGLTDDLRGFGRAWRSLRDHYAPKVLLGYELDAYGSSVEIRRGAPPLPTLIAGAREAATWYLSLFSDVFAFAAFEVGASAEAGQNANAANVYSTTEKAAVIDFVREFVRVSHVPVVIEGVPLGNGVMKTINDRPFHWRDSWVQWLIGTDGFSNLGRLRAAGVIGVQFGVGGGPNETCPCDAAHDGVTNGGASGTVAKSADDDGGYLAARMAALRQHGGLRLG